MRFLPTVQTLPRVCRPSVFRPSVFRPIVFRPIVLQSPPSQRLPSQRPYTNARILEVERRLFTPLVFSTSGGMGEEAKPLFMMVAAKMADKTGQHYSDTITMYYGESLSTPREQARWQGNIVGQP